MKILPTKNYTPLSGLNQLCLPMDAGVLIPPDDSVRLLVFVLKQLNLKPLYEAYAAYGEQRRRENPPSMADFPVGSFGFAKTPPARRWRTALETAASMPPGNGTRRSAAPEHCSRWMNWKPRLLLSRSETLRKRKTGGLPATYG
jgi:hypothetical protein